MGKSKRRQRWQDKPAVIELHPELLGTGVWRPVLVKKGLVKPGQPLILGDKIIISRDDYMEGQYHAAMMLLRELQQEVS